MLVTCYLLVLQALERSAAAFPVQSLMALEGMVPVIPPRILLGTSEKEGETLVRSDVRSDIRSDVRSDV